MWQLLFPLLKGDVCVQNRWKMLGGLLLLSISLSMIAFSDSRPSESQYPDIWKTRVDAAPTNATPMPVPPEPEAPGLESVFAIIGLVAVAYSVPGKRSKTICLESSGP
jgi:hypothetical protein